jgi:hypothetical protein
MRPCILAATALLGPALVACSDGVSVRAELMRLPEPTVVAAGEAALSIPPWTSNVTLTSVRAPITEISITRASGAGPGIVVYDCPGSTASACMVELNGPALESLLPTSPVAVEPGTYEEIVVSHCLPGATGWTAQITGTAVLGGTTYYTRTAGNRLGTTGPAQPVTVSFDGCGLLSPILPPLVISDVADATILLRLYFDMRDLAWAALTDPSTQHLLLLPGCSGINPTGFICTAYTSVFAVPGTDVPVVERYRLNASATFGLVFEPGADRFVGGYIRRYYVEDAASVTGGFSPDGHFDIFTPNGTGTYRLAQSYPPHMESLAFQRATHSGTLTTEVGGPTPLVVPYTAVRLP